MAHDPSQPFNVLFLCTGNSARSILAEALLNRAGQGKFEAYSAGSMPKGEVHPYTLDLLRRMNFDVSGARSKSWTEFAQARAPKLDFVFTVCDNAANETCPLFRRLTAEGLGAAILVATVVGSGIMAEKLAGGNQAIALLGNTIPTGAILVVLITILAPVSGAHFNPAVSLVFAGRGDFPWRDVLPYIIVQCAGGIA